MPEGGWKIGNAAAGGSTKIPALNSPLHRLGRSRDLSPPPPFGKSRPALHPSLLLSDAFTRFRQEARRLAAWLRLTGTRSDQSGRLETAAGSAACCQRPRLNARSPCGFITVGPSRRVFRVLLSRLGGNRMSAKSVKTVRVRGFGDT